MQPHEPDLSSLDNTIDPSLVLELSPDSRAVALRELSKAAMAVQTLYQMIEKASPENPATVEFASTVLRALEFCVDDLSKTFQIPTQTQAEIEARYASLRAANGRIHALEAEMAAKSGYGVAFGLKHLESQLNAWWRQEGFGHVQETAFHSHGVRATLSGHLFGLERLLEDESPVTARAKQAQWLQGLRGQGFVLAQEPGSSRDPFLVDCDATRQALRKLLARTLPSAEIVEVTSTRVYRVQEVLRLSEVIVLVRDLDELAALPSAVAQPSA